MNNDAPDKNTSRKRKRRFLPDRRLRWYIVLIHSMPFLKLAVEDRSHDGDETVLRGDLLSPAGSLGPPHLDFP